MEKFPPPNARSTVTPEEPLALSAPLARQLAPQLCQKDAVSGEDCSWNHGFWQYLRLLGLITTPRHHADFFRQAFAGVAGDAGPPRVLISGAADYSMLAHVLAAFGERGIAPAVTVVDRCETPLFLNRWYAERLSRSIESCRSDILEYQSAAAFDAVCSHSFLGQFALPQRVQLMAKWRQLLRPGGLAITVNRIRLAAVPTKVGFSDEQARTFSATVLRQAEAMRETVAVDPQELAQQARIYAGRQAAYPVKSLEEIRGLFEHAGFSVEYLACAPVAAGARNAVSGPTTPGSAEYACIVARRL